MLPGRTYTLGEILGIAADRWWCILLPFLAGTVTGVLAYRWTPAQYLSETLIVIERAPAAGGGPASSIQQQLPILTDRVMSRSSLERISRDLLLDKEQAAGGMVNDVVRRLRADTEVQAEEKDVFRIGYKSTRPETAQRVAQQLASLYVEESRRLSESSVQSPPTSVQSQLEDAKRRLVEQEKKLNEHLARYDKRLPAEIKSSFDSLNTAQMQLQASRESMVTLRERRLAVERQLARNAALPGEAVSTNLTSQPAGTPEASRQVVLAIPEESADDSASLRAELDAIDRQLASAKAEEDRLKKRVAAQQARIQRLPARGSELFQLTQDYAALQRSYATLLTQSGEAELSTREAQLGADEQFKILRPATLPDRPFNRRRRLGILAAGASGGLVLGILCVALLEYRDSTFKTELDVERVLSLPVFAKVPEISGKADTRSGPHHGAG